MVRPWEADVGAGFRRRIGASPVALGVTKAGPECPDIWELDNGDVAIIGRDITDAYRGRLPSGVSVSADERLVVIPRVMAVAAKQDWPDA